MDGFVERQLQVVAQVRAGWTACPASATAGRGATEEGVEDIAEALETTERAVALRTRAGPTHAGTTEHVVLLAASRIAQDLVGLVELLEARVGVSVGVDVWVPLLGQLSERALDLFVTGTALQAQDLVVVAGCGHAMPEYREGRPDAPATGVKAAYPRLPMQPLAISAAAARRFLVRRHLLAPARRQAAGLDGVRVVFDRLGSIQFDPLAVAGRNHDLVLHARVGDYDPAWTNELLYQRRELFEAYNKGLSLLPTAELPWHRHTWDTFKREHEGAAFRRHEQTVQHVLARIREEGPLCSLDFERMPAVDWYWGPTGEVRAVLEALSEAGIVGVARREGNRRFYDLTERLFPAALLGEERPDREQRRHRLLSRYRAHGLLGAGGQSELWYGIGPALRPRPTDPPGTITRAELLAELVSTAALVPVTVAGVGGTRYVLAGETAALESAASDADRGAALDDPSVAFLAPLDPLVWDRRLLRSLFDFDYVWEVYVPQAKRRWGYYVLPLLWGDRLVGRIEPRIDRVARTIRVLGVWWQDGFSPRCEEGFVSAMREALAAYAGFGRVERIDWGHLGAERRLFGVRPRRA